jgi:hypothetical protein
MTSRKEGLMTTWDSPLLRRATCPHCWHNFAPENVLWVSGHSDLLGDPRLGAEHQQRFLPTRFNLEGNALDSHGVTCMGLACPNCHLSVPRGLLEMEPFFVSILGAPGSGKSYLLSAMSWQLRQVLPRDFAISFQDADLQANAILNEYEQSLFLNAKREELVPLNGLIRKTEVEGQVDDSVKFGNQEVIYPRPFMFSLTVTEKHPNAEARQRLSRMLCLYDNAGEHFQPGMDDQRRQATRHLAQSRLLLFLFDPTQDQRFRDRLQRSSVLPPALFSGRQEVVLLETAARVRKLTNLAHSDKHRQPLLVLVTKHDVWASLLNMPQLREDPWKPTRKEIAAVDTELINECSNKIRRLILETCPEIVNAAEGFAQHVVYIPVSALGRKPAEMPGTGVWGIKPRNVEPLWATVPLIYGLCRSLQGVIPSLKAPSGDGRPSRGVHRQSKASAFGQGGK